MSADLQALSARSLAAEHIRPTGEATISAIGKYRIIELLGEGSMGVVYKAVDPVIGRPVAIKVMNESIAKQENLRKRFLHEAQAAGSLQHPNVVCIYDLGEENDHLFIAMEFVQGVDLESLIGPGQPLSLQARLDIIIDVLTGLAFAHKHGIIHRDIKPTNIRVGEDGRAKIMDFGVAHLASSTMTTTGAVLGTPCYMAPEQITEGSATPATDIFAVGAVLYQILAHVRPFEGPTTQNLLFKIVIEEPRPVRELMPGLPVALDRIVQKAMAKEPSKRYTSALDMANDLSSVRSTLSVPPEPASLSATAAGAIAQSKTTLWRRRRSLAYVGGGILVAGSAIAIALPQLTNPAFVTAEADSGAPVTLAATRNVPLSDKSNARPSALVRDGGVTRVAVKRFQPRLMRTPDSVIEESPLNLTREDVGTSPPPVAQLQPISSSLAEAVRLPAPAPPGAADIAPAAAAFARAIESRDIGAIRRVYPGLTARQQQGFEQLFQAARSITVSLRVSNIESSGTSADARLVGNYQYVTTAGRSERQPVSFAAHLRHDGSVWRLVSMR